MELYNTKISNLLLACLIFQILMNNIFGQVKGGNLPLNIPSLFM